MLELKNIKTCDGIISAEYDPENSSNLGSVSINIENGEFLCVLLVLNTIQEIGSFFHT